MPSAIVHCNQNEAGQQSDPPACLADVQLENTGVYATGLLKLTHKMDEICINGKFSAQEPIELRFFLHTCE